MSLQAKREQMAEAALFKKDPDAYQAKMEAMEAARMRMQARHDEVRGEFNYKYGHDQGTRFYVHNEEFSPILMATWICPELKS